MAGRPHVLGNFRDVTERKEMEAQLAQADGRTVAFYRQTGNPNQGSFRFRQSEITHGFLQRFEIDQTGFFRIIGH